MTDFYQKTLTTDLLNTINHTNPNNLNHRTLKQRMIDYLKLYNYKDLNQKCYSNKRKNWVARALQATQNLNIHLEDQKIGLWPLNPKSIPYTESENLSDFYQDLRSKAPQEPPHTEVTSFTDGSLKENIAGCGIWSEQILTLPTSFRTLGQQNIYTAELQAALCAIAKSPPNCKHTIKIDNAAALSLCSSVKTWDTKKWRKTKDFRHAKLIKEAICHKEKQGVTFLWEKVKSHTGIKGNEEADHLANQGRTSQYRYLNEKDLIGVGPNLKATFTPTQETIDNNYRQFLTKKEKEKTHI